MSTSPTHITRVLPKSHVIYTIAVIGFIYALHVAVPMYYNSSFLNLFTDERTVGYIYMAGAALSIFGFLIASPLIRRFGNYKMAVTLVALQTALFSGLVFAHDARLVALFFILQSAVISMIGLTLDIFLEVYTDGMHAGTVRGLFTAALNASWLIAPFIGSSLLNGTSNFRNPYIAALLMLFPLIYLIYRNFPRFRDPNYMHLSPLQLFRHISHNSDWVKLFSANLILQTFYAWMVVYSPIYLNKTIGFGWHEIGIILTIMLVPFPLIQYPAGRLADTRYGEKEMMAIGFFIMGLATILLAYVTSSSLLVWAGALFLTRVGAAVAEVMMETYFFKTVSPRDTGALGIFRITRPVAYFIAPLITIIGLFFTTNSNLFIIIGLFTLIGLYPSLTIKDTQ